MHCALQFSAGMLALSCMSPAQESQDCGHKFTPTCTPPPMAPGELLEQPGLWQQLLPDCNQCPSGQVLAQGTLEVSNGTTMRTVDAGSLQSQRTGPALSVLCTILLLGPTLIDPGAAGTLPATRISFCSAIKDLTLERCCPCFPSSPSMPCDHDFEPVVGRSSDPRCPDCHRTTG